MLLPFNQWYDVVHLIHLWQMLLATVADEIANLICIFVHLMADVIAMWQMLKPLQGGCVVADVVVSGSGIKWQ